MKSVDLMSLCTFVKSVLLCSSVRNITHPLDEIRPMRLVGEFYLSRWIIFSLTEYTVFTEFLAYYFEFTRRLYISF